MYVLYMGMVLKYSLIFVVLLVFQACKRTRSSVSRSDIFPTPLYGAAVLCYRFANNTFVVAFIYCQRQRFLFYAGQTFLFH